MAETDDALQDLIHALVLPRRTICWVPKPVRAMDHVNHQVVLRNNCKRRSKTHNSETNKPTDQRTNQPTNQPTYETHNKPQEHGRAALAALNKLTATLMNWRSALSALLLTSYFRRFLTISPDSRPHFMPLLPRFYPDTTSPFRYLTLFWTQMTHISDMTRFLRYRRLVCLIPDLT